MRRASVVAAGGALVLAAIVAPGAGQAAKIVKKEVPVPVGVAASADGAKVWLASAVQGGIIKLSQGAPSKPIPTRSGNANFVDLWTTPSGGRAYALDEDLATVRILRWGATKYTSVKVGDEPAAVTGGVSYGRKVLYVLNVGAGTAKSRPTVSVIDRSNAKVVATWKLPKGQAVQTQAMALSPDGSRLYVGNLSGEGTSVYVLSTQTGKVVHTLDTAYPDDDASTSLEVSALAVDPSGRYVFAAAMPGSATAPYAGTYKLDAATGRVVSKRLVKQNYISSLAVVGTTRVVALSGNADEEGQPGTVQVLKRKNLKPARKNVTTPPAIALAVSTKGSLSRAHVVSPTTNEYWAIPF